MSTNTDPKAAEPTEPTKPGRPFPGWLPTLSLSHWLAIVTIPFGLMGALYLFWQEDKTRVEVYVPAHDLPAYHPIQPSDLTPKPYAARSVPSGSLKTPQAIVDRYTLIPLPKEKPLTASQLGVKVNPTCLTDTIAVSLPATPAMTFGGTLKAGDTISLTFSAPPETREKGLPPPALLADLLVLDVKAALQPNTPFTSVIVIALPKAAANAVATRMAGATALVSRSLSGKGNTCVVNVH